MIWIFLLNCYVGFGVFLLGRDQKTIPNTYFHLIAITLIGFIALVIMLLSFVEAKIEAKDMDSKLENLLPRIFIAISSVIFIGAVIVFVNRIIGHETLHIHAKTGLVMFIAGFSGLFSYKVINYMLKK